jgi:hypothetical protein
MRSNFATLLKEDRHWHVLNINSASMGYLNLRLHLVIFHAMKMPYPKSVILHCINAVEYSIKPKDPATMEGGPPIQYHEQHLLLDQPGLQCEPGGDGEVFNPPLKLSLLILDQSHIIAEKFEIEMPPPKSAVTQPAVAQ